MKRFFHDPLADTPANLMKRAGYERHCIEAGKICFHRRLSQYNFPRFHALISVKPNGMEIDLHIDQYSMHRHGNHDESWAYEGGRINGELQRIGEVIQGTLKLGKVNQPKQPVETSSTSGKTKKRQSLFNLLFK